MQQRQDTRGRERGTSTVRITGLKAVELRDWGGQSLVKVETDAGVFGVGEAGTAGPVAREHLRLIAPIVVGRDPLDVEMLFDEMADLMHPYRSSMPTVSGVDIALWDLAGRILGRPVSGLLAGRFRDVVRLYYTGSPDDPLHAASVRRWAKQATRHADGYSAFKCDITSCIPDAARRFRVARVAQSLDRRDLEALRRGFANIRDAIGDEADLVVHCHNELDLASARGLAEAVVEARPLWIEDALPLWYSESWKSLHAASPVPLATGEKLESAREFLPFLVNGALDAIHPDLCFAGGITGTRRIAELAGLFYLPVVTHCVGSAVQVAASAHFGAMTRNFLMSETRIYANPVVRSMVAEDLVVKDGHLAVPGGPGLGVTLVPEVVNAARAAGEPAWD
jgi:L-alanine-DL-glutamate epimerase-like enolase superfamily enzyme